MTDMVPNQSQGIVGPLFAWPANTSESYLDRGGVVFEAYRFSWGVHYLGDEFYQLMQAFESSGFLDG